MPLAAPRFGGLTAAFRSFASMIGDVTVQDRFDCPMGDMRVRVATVKDAAAILGIYGYYVENLAVTFECEVPSLEDIEGRMARTLARYPYFVAELLPAEGVGEDVVECGKCAAGCQESGAVGAGKGAEPRVIGFAYAGPLRSRSAYDRAVETSIYVDSSIRGKGAGRALYQALEAALAKMGVLDMYACVACADDYDEHLSDASIRFHERLGFSRVGMFKDCGHKFGRWYSISWMSKPLGEHVANPPALRPFPEVCSL